MKHNKLLLITAGLISLVAVIALLIFINQKPTHKTGETVYYGNELAVTSQQICHSNGFHGLLSSNNPILPNNPESHGHRIEINYPLISFTNKQVESIINQQIIQLFGIDRDDPLSFYGGGCDVAVDFDCELLADILIVSITGDSYTCGAAHGSQWQKTQHFDLSTGKTINVTDLFHSGHDYEHDLGVIILQHFKDRNNYTKEYDSYFDDESDLVKFFKQSDHAYIRSPAV